MINCRGTIFGTIGKGNMACQTTWTTRDIKGTPTSVPFTRFSLYGGSKKDSKTKEESWQIIVSTANRNKERNDGLLQHLKPGRQVLVYGRITFAPRAIIDKDGNPKAYANPKIYEEGIQLVDASMDMQITRFCNMLVASGAITKEGADKYADQLKIYAARATETSGGKPEVYSEDPDEPDFTP